MKDLQLFTPEMTNDLLSSIMFQNLTITDYNGMLY